VGKILAAFTFFLAASAFALHESRPHAPPHASATLGRGPTLARVEPMPIAPTRVTEDRIPPWVRYAPPPVEARTTAAPTVAAPGRAVAVDGESERDGAGAVLDVIDRCPDEPDDNRDDDGCPEPAAGPLVTITGE
jgi:hypothetical protein